MDSAHQDGQALREGGVESPEAPTGCRHQAEGDSSSRSWGPAACMWAIMLWGCRKARPFPNRDSHQPQRSTLPLTTPRVYGSGKPKFICQIQDNPDCSGLFFLPFPNRIWACSLKGEVVRSDWPGPSARSQETSPTSRIAQRVTGSASLS